MQESLSFRVLFLLGILLQTQALSAEVKFGATLTLTGSGATFAQNARAGMELAQEEINQGGGIRSEPLKIVYEDFGETDLKRAASAAHKLINVDRVHVLLPMITEDAEVIWPIARKKQMVTMAVYAGSPTLTRDKPLLFQVSSSDEVLVRTLLDHAAKQGSSSLCSLTEQTGYFLPLEHFAAEYWEGVKPRHSIRIEYAPEVSDFKSLLLKLKTSGCSALLLLTSPNRQGTVLAQIHEMNWKVLRLGLDTSEDTAALAVAGSGAENLVYAKYMTSTEDFANKFRARFGHEVGVPAALAYDAVRILAQVMNERGRESTQINAGLQALRDYPGASGNVTFGPDGTRLNRPAELWTIQNGILKPLGDQSL